ncbi:MAG TPA: FlgD immunoglobulin-like domain containing protein, partial [Candidatus Cloacimonadota bacterium]|nr:FlgD immunoglobulin-like domain containing protein [Candidatus Cloacimonadota bacterium]
VALFILSSMFLYAGPVNTNLLANPGFQSGWDSWTYTNGGNGWYLWSIPTPLPSNPDYIERGVTSSYGWCTYSQEIDLLAAGFTAEELDAVPFTIYYHTWVSTHWGGRYYITVEAGNASHGVVAQSNIGTESSYVTLPNDMDIPKRTIRDYEYRFTVNNAGVRYIYFKVGGRDTRTWAGHYGTVFDNNYVGINNSFDVPELRTDSATNISFVSATAHGFMEVLGIDNPIQHGHCWNTTGMPTITDSKSNLGSIASLKSFSSSLTGLSAETQYFVRSYATNSAGTAYGEQVTFTTGLGVSNQSPANGVEGRPLNPEISWELPGVTPDGYRLYLGTDNPPTDLVYDGLLTSFQPSTPLLYNQEYFWRVVPYIGEDSSMGDVWSFTTTDTYESGVLPGVDGINPEVALHGISGNVDPVISAGMELPGAPFDDDGLYFIISGVAMSGRQVVINPDLSFAPQNIAYRIEPSLTWQTVPTEKDWSANYVYFTVMDAKADGDLIVVFPNSESSTLPVELSSFAAILTGDELVMLTWTAQSESNLSGYRLYRSDNEVFASAQLISQLIPAQNSSTAQHYYFTDEEDLSLGTYYYWLESLNLDGVCSLYGPIPMLIETDNPEVTPPELPRMTALLNAFPNPFNPQTFLRYQLEDAAEVQMEVFNSKGQLVRSFQASHPQGGSFSFMWDGRDQNGREVSSGVYFYRMSSGNYSAAYKLTPKAASSDTRGKWG